MVIVFHFRSLCHTACRIIFSYNYLLFSFLRQSTLSALPNFFYNFWFFEQLAVVLSVNGHEQ